MFVVGLTGGIGSGKSAVSDLLAGKGITIVDADVVAREVVEPGTDALAQISAHFGTGILLPDGRLDRAGLRSLVFDDAAAKNWLEQLLHPLIGAEVYRQLQCAGSAYAVLVSPLLVETGQTVICDHVVVVDAPEALQTARTMARDDNSREQVQKIMASQAGRQQRLQAASTIIDNSGALPELEPLVDALHEKLLQLASEKTGAAF